MKKLLLSIGTLLLTSSVLAATKATIITQPNLAGVYTCNGYDNSEGNIQGTVALTLDAKSSDFKNGYATYKYKEVTTDGEKYSGSLIANGNILSEHFENNEPDEYDDRGVASILVSHDENAEGISQSVLHEFYYEPHYDGDTGTETCMKQT